MSYDDRSVDDRHYDVENPRMGHDPEVSEGDSGSPIIWIILAVAVLIGAGIGIFLFVRSTKKKDQADQPLKPQSGTRVSGQPVNQAELNEIGKHQIEVSQDPELLSDEPSCLSSVATAAGAAAVGLGLTAAGAYAYNKYKPAPPKKTGMAAYLPNEMPSAGACLAGVVAAGAAAFGVKKLYDHYLADVEKRFTDFPAKDTTVQLILDAGSPIDAKVVSHAQTDKGGRRTREYVVSFTGKKFADKKVKQIRWDEKDSRRTSFYNVGEGAKLAFSEKSGEVELAIEEAVNKTALLITIAYAHLTPEEGQLPGTRDDGFKMYHFLEKRGFTVTWMRDFVVDPKGSKPDPNSQLDARKDIKEETYPSAENIETMVKKIVKAQKAGDVLWFQYSGHGGQIPDDDGDEKMEADTAIHDPHSSNAKGPKDEVLVSADYKAKRVSYYDAMVRDDFFKKEFVKRLPPKMESFIVFDCCHSATMFDMDYMYTYDNKTKKLVEGPNNHKPAPGVEVSGRSVYLSGCQDSECAQELAWKDDTGAISKRGGALTFALTNILSEDGSDSIPIGQLLEKIDKEVEKRNQSPSISSSHPLNMETPFGELIDGK